MIPSSFPPPDEIARLTASMLLEIGAVDFNAAEPFTHASGKKAPTYVDCRRISSFPRARSILMDFLAATVIRGAGAEAFDVVAGGETAGIPFGAYLSERLALPMAYVRKKPKGYGRNARIEGVMREGDRVLLVEDLATDGGSKLSFVEAIRDTGATCAHTAVVFFYGIYPGVTEALGTNGVTLHSLCTWWDVLAVARETAGVRRRNPQWCRELLARPGGLAGRAYLTNWQGDANVTYGPLHILTLRDCSPQNLVMPTEFTSCPQKHTICTPADAGSKWASKSRQGRLGQNGSTTIRCGGEQGLGASQGCGQSGA